MCLVKFLLYSMYGEISDTLQGHVKGVLHVTYERKRAEDVPEDFSFQVYRTTSANVKMM